MNTQPRRYLITLVGSQEPNGSRTITTITDGAEVLFAVTTGQLAAYTPNPGDTLIRDDDGNITFEKGTAA